jgi:NADH:ubiquinone oxidoreductase subunit D
MIREDRELLAELGRLNSDVVPFAMKMMDESVTVTAQEQYAFADRLMAMGRPFAKPSGWRRVGCRGRRGGFAQWRKRRIQYHREQ